MAQQIKMHDTKPNGISINSWDTHTDRKEN